MGLTHNVVAIEEGLRLTCHIQTLQVEPGLFAFHRSFAMRGEHGLGICAHSEVWPACRRPSGPFKPPRGNRRQWLAQGLEAEEGLTGFSGLDLSSTTGEGSVASLIA